MKLALVTDAWHNYGAELARCVSGADAFVFPRRTDTCRPFLSRLVCARDSPPGPPIVLTGCNAPLFPPANGA